MGTIYKYDETRWRVQIRRQGYKTISSIFETYELAKQFHDKLENHLLDKKQKRVIKEALSKVDKIS